MNAAGLRMKPTNTEENIQEIERKKQKQKQKQILLTLLEPLDLVPLGYFITANQNIHFLTQVILS